MPSAWKCEGKKGSDVHQGLLQEATDATSAAEMVSGQFFKEVGVSKPWKKLCNRLRRPASRLATRLTDSVLNGDAKPRSRGAVSRDLAGLHLSSPWRKELCVSWPLCAFETLRPRSLMFKVLSVGKLFEPIGEERLQLRAVLNSARRLGYSAICLPPKCTMRRFGCVCSTMPNHVFVCLLGAWAGPGRGWGALVKAFLALPVRR